MRFSWTPGLLLVALLASGCYRTHFSGDLTTFPETTPRTDVLVVQMLYDRANPAEIRANGFIEDLADAAPGAFEASGVARRVIPEGESGSAPTDQAFLVRMQLKRFVDRSGEGMRSVVGGLAIFVVPLFFIGVPPAYRIAMDTEWEIRVYDVRGLLTTSVRDPDTGELVASFDVSMLSPILRRTVEVTLEGGLSGRDNRSRARSLEVFEQAADELTRRVVSEVLPDLVGVLSDVPAAPTGPEASPGVVEIAPVTSP